MNLSGIVEVLNGELRIWFPAFSVKEFIIQSLRKPENPVLLFHLCFYLAFFLRLITGPPCGTQINFYINRAFKLSTINRTLNALNDPQFLCRHFLGLNSNSVIILTIVPSTYNIHETVRMQHGTVNAYLLVNLTQTINRLAVFVGDHIVQL